MPPILNQVVQEEVNTNTLNDAFTGIINTTSSFGNNLVRKFLSVGATTLSAGFVGIIGYVIYRSYKSQQLSSLSPLSGRAAHMQLLNDIQDPTIAKGIRTREEIEEIEKRLDELKLSDEVLRQIMDILESEMDKGLSRHLNSEADLKMLPTYVCELPTGKESNDILALDLGGSNFRVLLIRLRENEPPQILNKVKIITAFYII